MFSCGGWAAREGCRIAEEGRFPVRQRLAVFVVLILISPVLLGAQDDGGATVGVCEVKRGETPPQPILPLILPDYPLAARKDAVRGEVAALIIVWDDGHVVLLRAELVDTPKKMGFKKAVREAVYAWHYKPAQKKDGTPKNVDFKVTISFDPTARPAVTIR